MKLHLDPRVRTAMVSDSLDTFGIRDNVMDSSIKPLLNEMRAVGIASTIEFVPDANFDPADPYGVAIDYLDSLREGEIAIVATGPSELSAYWGELFSTAAKSRGATGVVCDGPLRDTNLILEVGFAAFGASSRPIDYKGRMRVSKIHQQVVCGGVMVDQGDAVIADWDGIVVVPADFVERVFTAANERAQGERTVLQELQSGKSVRQVWDEYRLL
ncbi:MAG: RraA family protein [Actinomycetes bacterium]